MFPVSPIIVLTTLTTLKPYERTIRYSMPFGDRTVYTYESLRTPTLTVNVSWINETKLALMSGMFNIISQIEGE